MRTIRIHIYITSISTRILWRRRRSRKVVLNRGLRATTMMMKTGRGRFSNQQTIDYVGRRGVSRGRRRRRRILRWRSRNLRLSRFRRRARGRSGGDNPSRKSPNFDESESPFDDESESPFVDESELPFVDKSKSPCVDESESPFVNKSESPFVDESESPYGD